MFLTVETEVLAAKPVTVPLCYQLHCGQACDQERASAGEDPANNHLSQDTVCPKLT